MKARIRLAVGQTWQGQKDQRVSPRGVTAEVVILYPEVIMKNQQSNIVAIDINAVKSRMLQVRGQQVLLDRDVAALYGVETRIINQAVKNNPEKFPAGYVAELTAQEVEILRSKILTLEARHGWFGRTVGQADSGGA